MYTEIFEIEFQVPDVEEQYITFELWVEGQYEMHEVGGGHMGEALVLWDISYERTDYYEFQKLAINKWIEQNERKIQELFAERIKKYED